MAGSTTAPPRPIPPRRPMTTPAAPRGPVAFETPRAGARRIGIYGPGGIGKTSLAACAPGPVAFLDIDDSLGVLGIEGVQRVAGIEDWDALRWALQSDGWEGVKTLVIDSATKAEDMAVAWTLMNVPNERGERVSSVEDYGYGKGYTHVYETFMRLLGDLDAHIRAGRHVVLIAHDCTATVPNPTGEDYIRYEPRLQGPSSGKASIRLRVREWLDDLLYIGYDVAVTKAKGKAGPGKATGSGSRAIYPVESPAWMAKSRTLDTPLVYERGSAALWEALFGTAEAESVE